MREILFRGKRIDNGEWVCGSLLCNTPDKRVFIIYNYSQDPIEVNPETVGQDTGIIDKKGIKIFEGDIVRTKILYDIGCYPHEDEKIVEVEYIKGCFYPLYDYVRDTIEVIGNIYL